MFLSAYNNPSLILINGENDMKEYKINKPIVKNFGKAQALALVAIERYLTENARHRGKYRALKLKQYLQIIPENDHHALLAIFIAIFRTTSMGIWGYVLGRSNNLSKLISEQWIQGEDEQYSSEIFAQEALNTIGRDYQQALFGDPEDVTHYALRKKGIAALLENTIKQAEFNEDSKEIMASAKLLIPILDTDAKIQTKILPASIVMKKIYAVAVTNALFSPILTHGVGFIIGSYLTKAEVARSLLCVNRTSYVHAKSLKTISRKNTSHPLLNFIQRRPDKDEYVPKIENTR